MLHVCTLMLHTFKCLHIQSLYADVAYIQVFTHTRVTQAVQIRIQIHNMCCMFARWCLCMCSRVWIHVNVYVFTCMKHQCVHVYLSRTHSRQSGDAAVRPELLKKKKRQSKRQWCCGTSALGRVLYTGSSPRPSCGVCRFFFPPPPIIYPSLSMS